MESCDKHANGRAASVMVLVRPASGMPVVVMMSRATHVACVICSTPKDKGSRKGMCAYLSWLCKLLMLVSGK